MMILLYLNNPMYWYRQVSANSVDPDDGQIRH